MNVIAYSRFGEMLSTLLAERRRGISGSCRMLSGVQYLFPLCWDIAPVETVTSQNTQSKWLSLSFSICLKSRFAETPSVDFRAYF